MKRLFALILLALPLAAQAYTLLDPDEIRDTRPRWQRVPSKPNTPESTLQYLLQWRSDRSVEIRFLNTGAKDLHFHFLMPMVQPSTQGFNPRVSVPAGKTATMPLKIARFDQRFWLTQPRLWNIVAGPDTFTGGAEQNAPRGHADELPPVKSSDLSEQSFFAFPTRDGIDYEPRSLPYFLSKKSETTAEVHFRNLSERTVFFEFRILGYQDGMTEKNPRIKLRPMEERELLVPCARMDDHIPWAFVEVFNIRAGLDEGELLSPWGDGTVSERLTKPHDVSFVATATTSVYFNPWAIGQAVQRGNGRVTGVRFVNAGAKDAYFDFFFPQYEPLPKSGQSRRAKVPAGQSVDVPLDMVDKNPVALLYAMISNVRLGDDTGRLIDGTSNEVNPFHPTRGWLQASTVKEDALFNSHCVEYQIKPAGDHAEVTLHNRASGELFFDFSIAGFQDAQVQNPRQSIKSGAYATVKVPVNKTDVRLAVAKLVVSTVRLGKDEGSPMAPR